MWCCSKTKVLALSLSVCSGLEGTQAHISCMLIHRILRHSIFSISDILFLLRFFFVLFYFLLALIFTFISSLRCSVSMLWLRENETATDEEARKSEWNIYCSATLVVHTIRVYSFGIFSIRDHIVHLNWLTWHFDLTDIQCKSTKEIAISRTPTIVQSNELIIWLNLKARFWSEEVFFTHFDDSLTKERIDENKMCWNVSNSV